MSEKNFVLIIKLFILARICVLIRRFRQIWMERIFYFAQLFRMHTVTWFEKISSLILYYFF